MQILEQITIPLLAWYAQEGRRLPWRQAPEDSGQAPEPYHVWISEIMLQQTRVGAVLGYYARFLQALPTLQDLAAVSQDELLKLWQGLGYYSRARNLQKAARLIVCELAGQFPGSRAALLQLPGVGDYTASAIASICFGEPYAAVDGNLLRVVARLTADEGELTSPALKARVREGLEAVIPLKNPGAFNQALMDLGAGICLPNGAPLCARCPLNFCCLAHAQGRVLDLPRRAPKKPRREEDRSVFLLLCEGAVALQKRPEKGLLAGLWEFPHTLDEAGEPVPPAWLPAQSKLCLAGTGRHLFTHVEWRLRYFVGHLDRESLPEGLVWATRADLQERYALPSALAAGEQLLHG